MFAVVTANGLSRPIRVNGLNIGPGRVAAHCRCNDVLEAFATIDTLTEAALLAFDDLDRAEITVESTPSGRLLTHPGLGCIALGLVDANPFDPGIAATAADIAPEG